LFKFFFSFEELKTKKRKGITETKEKERRRKGAKGILES
jgi:hypothetical protein